MNAFALVYTSSGDVSIFLPPFSIPVPSFLAGTCDDIGGYLCDGDCYEILNFRNPVTGVLFTLYLSSIYGFRALELIEND